MSKLGFVVVCWSRNEPEILLWAAEVEERRPEGSRAGGRKGSRVIEWVVDV